MGGLFSHLKSVGYMKMKKTQISFKKLVKKC